MSRAFLTSAAMSHVGRETLLLEPDTQFGIAVRDALNRQGHRATLIGDGLHAVAHLQARLAARAPLPHLVVANVELPGVNALDVAASLRRAGCTLILLTSRVSDEVRARAKEVEALALFRKPFQAGDLAGFIAAHMDDE